MLDGGLKPGRKMKATKLNFGKLDFREKKVNKLNKFSERGKKREILNLKGLKW